MARRKKMGLFEAILYGLIAGAVKGVKSPRTYSKSRYTTRKRRTKSWI